MLDTGLLRNAWGSIESYRLSPPCLRLFAGAHHGTRAVVCYPRNEVLCGDSSVVNSQVSRYPLSERLQVRSQLVTEVGHTKLEVFRIAGAWEGQMSNCSIFSIITNGGGRFGWY